MVPQRGKGPALSLPVTLVALILVSSVLWSTRSAAEQTSDVVNTFVDPDAEAESLNHLVVDQMTGQVFVGGLTHLWQLSPDLKLVVKKKLGTDRTSTGNVTEALVIDYILPGLVYCHTLAEESCTITDIHNISNTIQEVQKVDISNDVTSYFAPFFSYGTTNRSVMESSPFPMTHVYGFSSDGFRYSLTIQPTSTDPEHDFVSKLIRVCPDDETDNVHFDITVECSNESTKYNLIEAAYLGKAGSDLARSLGITTRDDVLFAVFSKSDDTGNEPSSQSALCVYSYKAMRSKFSPDHQLCHPGDEETVPESDSEGGSAITASPVLTFDEHLTAVAATTTDDNTVVFLGTGDGNLRKVVVESAASGVNYGNVRVDSNSPVNSAMRFDPESEHLYVMTKQMVLRVATQDCLRYRTCSECYEAKDPYCGWCLLTRACVPKNRCQFPNIPPIWLMYKTKGCPYIESVTPSVLGRSSPPVDLQIKMINIPSRLGRLNCIFRSTESRLIIPATRRVGSPIFVCRTPDTIKIPYFLRRHGNKPIEIAIRWNKGGDLATVDFSYLDCRESTLCSECAGLKFPCDWCVDNHKCTDYADRECLMDVRVPSVGKPGSIGSTGIGICPKVKAIGSPEILIISGITRTIRVKVVISGNLMVQSKFSCEFTMEDVVVKVKAILLADTIYCDNTTEFSYTSYAGYIRVPFKVLWAGGTRALENPDNVHLVIYKCKHLANDCEKCLALDAKYNCGWCKTTNTCSVRNECTTANSDTFRNRGSECSDRNIRSLGQQPEL